MQARLGRLQYVALLALPLALLGAGAGAGAGARRAAPLPPPLAPPTDAEVVSLLEAAHVTTWSYDKRCFAHPASFREVVVVGSWSEEAKRCWYAGAAVPGTFDRGAAAATVTFGRLVFAKVAPERRREIALSFAREVLLNFDHVLDAPTPDFDTPHTPRFSAPTAESEPDSAVRIRTWIVEGDPTHVRYVRHAYRFAEDGAKIAVSDDRIAWFAVPPAGAP